MTKESRHRTMRTPALAMIALSAVIVVALMLADRNKSTGQPTRTDEERPQSKEPRALSSGKLATAISNRTEFKPDLVTFQKSVQPFLQTHCVSCHGAKKQEAGLRLDTITADFGRSTNAKRWTEVMDKLNAAKMPPKGQSRPDVTASARVTGWIATELRRREAAIRSTGGKVVLRRLNRAEYLNTMRDLFGSRIVLPQDIPADPPAHGFDNVGAALMLSPIQIEKYIAAAGDILDQVIPSKPRPPASVKWRFRMDDIYKNGLDKTKGYHRTYPHPIAWDGKPMRTKLFHTYEPREPFPRRHKGMVTVTSGTSALAVQFIRFPKGEYKVRIRAAARIPTRLQVVQSAIKRIEARGGNRSRLDEYRAEFQSSLDYQFGPPRMRIAESGGPRKVIDEIDVDAPVSRPKVYEFRCRLNENSGGILIGNYYRHPRTRATNYAGGPGFPQSLLFVDYIEFEGPIVEQWPPKTQTDLLGTTRGDEAKRALDVLTRFMPRAWRRPVTEAEIGAMLKLFQQRRADQPNFATAIKVPLLAVLSSPHFLFLEEPIPRGSTTVNDYQLASRISYFLWSSMPDDKLFQLAKSNRLSDRKTLLAQVDRILADKRSEQFVRNFTEQWLGLRKIGANPPSRAVYPRYDHHLEESMARESLGFFREILRNDRDVRNFIKSDFVTINERLARHYQIPGVRGDHIRRVNAPANSHRGGLLTQASIHTITSNGTRTSPVLRGKWILETLLGDPPPPPPPDAGEIPPKTAGRGRITVRKRLELHRKLPACAACHNKIDPLGFALENFRADGSWAEREALNWGNARKTDPPLDTTARMPDGTEIRGLAELQTVLLKREDTFLHHLAERVATYALGRGMEYSDRAWIKSLVAGMKNNGRTLRGLIKQIVTSPQFRSK